MASPAVALVVGLGTGESAGWLAEVNSIERVDVVELEPAVDEMARRCSAVNFNVLEHAKVRRIYNDAREVLVTHRECYDIIGVGAIQSLSGWYCQSVYPRILHVLPQPPGRRWIVRAMVARIRSGPANRAHCPVDAAQRLPRG